MGLLKLLVGNISIRFRERFATRTDANYLHEFGKMWRADVIRPSTTPLPIISTGTGRRSGLQIVRARKVA